MPQITRFASVTLSCGLIALGNTAAASAQSVLTAEVPLHLADHLDVATIIGSEVPAILPQPVEWRFDEPQPEWRPATPWREGMETVEPVQLDDGLRLPFTPGMANPNGVRTGAIYVDLPDWDLDDWGSVEIRARTHGRFGNVGLRYNYTEEDRGDGSFNFYSAGDGSRLISDGTVQTYRLSLNWADVSARFSDVRERLDGPWTHLAVWATCPGNQEEAALDILSITVIPAEVEFGQERTGVREFLQRDVSRRSLGAVYTHAPGRVEFPLRVPVAGRLDVRLGLLKENSPVTFRVKASSESGAETMLLEETYTDAAEWGQRIVDLSSFEGDTVTLALETDAAQPGAVAFWTDPTIGGIKDEYRPRTYPGQEDEPVDLDATRLIIAEAFQRSQVMDLAGMLTDVHGSRLRGSSRLLEAGEWAVETLDGWEIQDPRMELLEPPDPG